jgi:hypothetical protein
VQIFPGVFRGALAAAEAVLATLNITAEQDRRKIPGLGD